MRFTYVFILILCLGIIIGSAWLIPNKAQLDYITTRPEPVQNYDVKELAEKQDGLEKKIEQEGLRAQYVSELADSYVAQGKTDEAIALMERYHAKYPADIQMLDKLGIIYHVAGMEDKYISILEEQNELLPSVNVSYILQAHYSRKYGEDKHPEKTVRVLQHLIKLQPNDTQNYKNLIFFLFKANRGDEVIRVVKRFRERFPDQVDYGFIFPLVDQLIKLGYYDEAYREAKPWAEKEPELALKDFATMFVNAGKPEYAVKLLEGQEQHINKDPFLMLVSVRANAKNDPDKALTTALEWMRLNPVDETMLRNFGNIFFDNERYHEIIALYMPNQPMVMSNKNLLDIYREALQRTYKEQPQYAMLLAEIYVQELNSKGVSEQRQKSLVLALQDIGYASYALPYARNNAFTHRGDWVLLYENMLEMRGEREKLANFRAQYVRTMQLTEQEKNYYKAIFMQQENKFELERILWAQAQGKSHQSREVQDLLYIWGLDPQPKRIAWLEERARNSSGEEQMRWMKSLEAMGAYENMVRVVATVPEKKRSLPMIQGYFNTLHILKEEDVRHEEIAIAIEGEQVEENLAYYTELAKEHQYYDLAARGYERLIGMNPKHIEYMKERGMVAYYSGDMEAAMACLNDYYEAGGDDVMALYFFAELLQQRSTLQAKPLYEQTLMMLDSNPKLTQQERIIRVHVLARLYRYEEARTEIAKLIEEDPSNPYLRLDNIELHLDMAEHERAEELLGEPIPAKLDLEPLFKIWSMDSAGLVRVEYRPLPNEVLLVYERPIKKLPHVNERVNFHPEWITQFSAGYDSVLVSAEWGYELDVRVEGQNLIFESKKINANPTPYADESLYIRRQLLHARIEQETHRTADAITRLEKLREQYPDDLGTVTGLSIANRAYGRRLIAMDLAQEAHLIDPDNRWVNILIADLKKPDIPYLRLDYQWLHLQISDQFTTKLSGFRPVSRNWRLGAAIENNLYSFKKLQLSNGLIGKDSGTAQRAQVDGIYESEAGPIYTGSLLFNPDATLGAALHARGKNKFGDAEAYVEYHRPEWRFVERIPDNAIRNRVGVQQVYSPETEVFTTFGAALTDYSQDNQDHATQTIWLYGNIHAPIERIFEDWQYVPLIVGYGIDAEYVIDSKFAYNQFGDRYRLYPLISREVHYVEASYRRPIDESAYGLLTGSYAYDRMSGFADRLLPDCIRMRLIGNGKCSSAPAMASVSPKTQARASSVPVAMSYENFNEVTVEI